jgi:hypothetical protein
MVREDCEIKEIDDILDEAIMNGNFLVIKPNLIT